MKWNEADAVFDLVADAVYDLQFIWMDICAKLSIEPNWKPFSLIELWK